MLEVLPIQTKDEQQRLAALCDTPYLSECMAYGATVNTEDAGICQFSIDHEGGSIQNISCVTGKDDFEVSFVLGRAAMNFLDLAGVKYAFFDGEIKDEILIKAIGFDKREDGRYFVELTDFFTSPCSHKK